jgi:hypothetical protein
MSNLIIGHARDAGLAAGFEERDARPGMPQGLRPSGEVDISAFGQCEPTYEFVIPPLVVPAKAGTHNPRETFGEDWQ